MGHDLGAGDDTRGGRVIKLPTCWLTKLRLLGFRSGTTGWSVDLTDEGEAYLFIPLSDEGAGLTIIPQPGSLGRYCTVRVDDMGCVVRTRARLNEREVLDKITKLTR